MGLGKGRLDYCLHTTKDQCGANDFRAALGLFDAVANDGPGQRLKLGCVCLGKGLFKGRAGDLAGGSVSVKHGSDTKAAQHFGIWLVFEIANCVHCFERGLVLVAGKNLKREPNTQKTAQGASVLDVVIVENRVDIGSDLVGEDFEGGVIGVEQLSCGPGNWVVEPRQIVLSLYDLLCGRLGEGMSRRCGEKGRDSKIEHCIARDIAEGAAIHWVLQEENSAFR